MVRTLMVGMLLRIDTYVASRTLYAYMFGGEEKNTRIITTYMPVLYYSKNSMMFVCLFHDVASQLYIVHQLAHVVGSLCG